jgi:hypothetical protein
MNVIIIFIDLLSFAVRITTFRSKADKMNSKMGELMRATPLRIHFVSFGVFVVVLPFMALLTPLFAFALGALIFLCFIHAAANLPAIRCTEGHLYGEDPLGFFDLKVKFTLWLWTAGIIIMVIISVAVAILLTFVVNSGQLYAYEAPQIDLISSLILLMISLTPFIPATFVLMKASYEYDQRTMTGASLILIIIMGIGIPLTTLMYSKSTPLNYVPIFHTFEILPYLPLSICALAASLIATYFLSKSAKRSFIRYIEGDNE